MRKRRDLTSDPLIAVTQVNKRKKHIGIDSGRSCFGFLQDANPST